MFYGNILAAAYRTYGRFKNENPYSRSIFFTCMCQILFIFLLISIIKKFEGINLLTWMSGNAKYYAIPIYIIWIVVFFKYYSKERVQNIVAAYDEKPLFIKRMWGFIALISIIIPILFFPFLLKKV